MEEKQLHVLVERSRSGDRAAQEELIAFVQNFVYYHCCKLLNDRESALDVTQEVLLAMVRGLPGLKEPAAFHAWLLKIICNRCRNYQTRGPKECQMPESPNGGALLDTWAEELVEQLPERALEESETARLVRQLVDQLPTDQRVCILMFYYDELTVREIAAALSVPTTTVKTRLYRARKTLRKGLHRHGVSALTLTALISSVLRAEPSARLLPVLSASAKGAAAGTVVKCAAGIIGVGLIFSGFLGLQNLNRTDPPQLPEPTVVGERELLEALRTVTRQPSDDLMTQFYSYYRTLGHFYELAMMPDFDETHAADWDALTLYSYLNADRAEDLTVTREELADTLGRFLPTVTYEDRSSAYLTYENGIYMPVPGDTMWSGYFRLTDWSVDASGLFTAQFDMLMFHELEYNDYETLRPNMKYLWDTSGIAPDGNMDGEVLQDTILQVFQQPDYGEHLAMTETLDVQFRLSDDPAYPLQYYARSRTVCAAEGEAVPPW